MKPIVAYFDGILPSFHLWGLLRQILMAFPPFSLMKPIVACFDGILSPFDLLGPYRQILMAFCPGLTYKAQIGIF